MDIHVLSRWGFMQLNADHNLSPVANFTEEVNPGLEKTPLNSNGGLAETWLTSS